MHFSDQSICAVTTIDAASGWGWYVTVVVFDLDGTLVESAAAIRDVANVVMSELGLAPLDLAETRSFVGRGSPVFLERALKSRAAFDGAKFDEHLARLYAVYAEAPGQANVPFGGVDETLDRLAMRGYRLAICTNKPLQPTLSVISAHGWQRRFDPVIAGDSQPWRKPDPRPLRAAIGDAADAVFVGDSEVDAETAAAAGVPFVFYTEGYCHGDASSLTKSASFSRFSDLPAIIDGIITDGASN